ncbi:hypothetical protein BGZ73_007021 [Actinomortierella ambigua]|nr:hypothetical protein BGZ73_007021 [Actinomortierella ambigua]
MASVKTFITLLRPRILSSATAVAPPHDIHRHANALQRHAVQVRTIRTRGRSVVRREIVGLQSTPFERPSPEDSRPKRGRPSALKLFDAEEEPCHTDSDDDNDDEDDRLHEEQQRIVADQRNRSKNKMEAESQKSTANRSEKAQPSASRHAVKPHTNARHDPESSKRAQKKSAATTDAPPSQLARGSKTKHSSSDEPRVERVSKTLEAFPFIPGATTQELTVAHKFFVQPATFVKSASNLEMLPQDTLMPEVAFIGRSNIGKSSLINGLVNRNGLVKTSSKPGHTRLMNFFKIGGRLSLVDMPGYGFKSRDEWGEMILDYFQNRSSLKRIYILVDPSHGIKDSDKQIMGMLDKFGMSYQVVLTKTDKLSAQKLKAAKAEIEGELAREAICCFPQLLAVSSRKKQGLDELRAAILKAAQLS